MRNKVLLVDDDPNILAAYTRALRKRFSFDTAASGEEALALLRGPEPYAVILSDMRMPGMDGMQLLAEARGLAPDSVRIMLTGNADMDTAIQAMNRGNCFRFLTKPCDSETLAQALEAGIEQYQLVTAEKELVEGTLKGTLDLLVELLSISDPEACARARALEPLAQKLARALGLESSWVVSCAATLSQVGALTFPTGILARVRAGEPASESERQSVARLPEISAGLIHHIPRMDPVAAAILYMRKNYDGTGFPPDARLREEELPLAARILKVAADFLDLAGASGDRAGALEAMERDRARYDPRVLAALAQALEQTGTAAPADPDAPRLATHDTLQPGQVLVEGVQTREGMLVYPPLTRVGQSHLARLKNFASLVGLREPFLVLGQEG
jgi:response regulator RpfG family c-di-GMP phosphodiesterase